MALTPLRWMAAALAGALVAITYLAGAPTAAEREADPRQQLMDRERALEFQSGQLADRLRAAIVVDSVQRATRPTNADSMRIIIDRGVPSAMRNALGVAARRAQSELGTTPLPVDVVFVLDTARVVRGVLRGERGITGEFVLPRSAGERCVAIVRLRVAVEHEPSRALLTFAGVNHRRILGPCAFVGAFGMPGRHVAEWLAQGGWMYGVVTGWTRSQPRWSPPAWYGSSASYTDGFPLRGSMGSHGYRCATGDVTSCEPALMRASAARPGAIPLLWGGRIVSPARANLDWWYRSSLGPLQAGFLSDMVHGLGPDQFRAFWASPLPVSEAYRAATGTSIGDATAAWATSHYQGYAYRGPAVPVQTAGLALLFIGGGAAAAVFASRRRRVT